MIRSRRTLLALTLLLSGILILATAPRALAGGIEGKWKVKVQPDADVKGEKEFDDTLTFTATKFTSEALKKRGFGEATYEEDTRRFGPTAFTAESTSEKEGKVKWTGTATAVDIKGDLTITKKDGTEVHFSYVGSKS